MRELDNGSIYVGAGTICGIRLHNFNHRFNRIRRKWNRHNGGHFPNISPSDSSYIDDGFENDRLVMGEVYIVELRFKELDDDMQVFDNELDAQLFLEHFNLVPESSGSSVYYNTNQEDTSKPIMAILYKKKVL